MPVGYTNGNGDMVRELPVTSVRLINEGLIRQLDNCLGDHLDVI